jgi:hypothetical protein
MRHFFTATATIVVILATGALSDRAGAADVGAPFYVPRSGYAPPPAYNPSDEYGPLPGYGPPSVYGPPDDYGPPPDYDLPPRPPHSIPYAVSPIRPACDLQWRCGPLGCGWRRVCYPERYARPYRGYSPPPGPTYYGPY